MAGLVRLFTAVRKPFCAAFCVSSMFRFTTSGAEPRFTLAMKSCTIESCLSNHCTLMPGLAFSNALMVSLMYPSNLGLRYHVQKVTVVCALAVEATRARPRVRAFTLRFMGLSLWVGTGQGQYFFSTTLSAVTRSMAAASGRRASRAVYSSSSTSVWLIRVSMTASVRGSSCRDVNSTRLA